MTSNDASTNSINNWLERLWPDGCIVVEYEWDFQESSHMGCPANLDAIMIAPPKWCIEILDEWLMEPNFTEIWFEDVCPKWCIVIVDEWDYSQIGIGAYNPNGLKRLNIINPTWHCIIIVEEF